MKQIKKDECHKGRGNAREQKSKVKQRRTRQKAILINVCKATA